MDENRERERRDIQVFDDLSSPAEREQSIAPERVLSAVANEHRCAILDSLNSASEKTLEYDALVDHVVDRVGNEDVERVSAEHRQRVRIALRHTHLPKLEATRIIDYEDETGEVRFIESEFVHDLLALVKSHDVHE